MEISKNDKFSVGQLPTAYTDTNELRDWLVEILSLPNEQRNKIESIEFELNWIPSFKANITLKK